MEIPRQDYPSGRGGTTRVRKRRRRGIAEKTTKRRRKLTYLSLGFGSTRDSGARDGGV